MNYFDYFTEIEDTFIRRRGKHLLLSPMDWALIESWKEMGVPLHVALRGIERAFDSHEAKNRKRSVKTLLYCQEEVEVQYAEWLESRVGSHQKAQEAQEVAERGATALSAEAVTPESDKTAFPRSLILRYLDRSREALIKLCQERRQSMEDEFCEAVNRAAALLSELESDYATSAQPEARKLEDSLTGIERMLDGAIRRVISEPDFESARAETELQLDEYRRHMDNVTYEQTFENLLRKRLRELFGVPRLSLFFISSAWF